MYQLNLDIAHFLEHYWQKRPLLIKGGFTDFQDPISPDELAGLAMEKRHRIAPVTRFNNKGGGPRPLRILRSPGEENWTVLVQACNHWVPEVHELAVPFQFIPAGALTM
jgi:50S ribosomal protein L16 3-hydroxylase